MQGKSAAERRRVGKLSVGDMFSVGNVVKAIRAVRKGTVPGRDGFPTEFYSKDHSRKTGRALSKALQGNGRRKNHVRGDEMRNSEHTI